MRGRPAGKHLQRKDIYSDEFKRLITYIKDSNKKKIAKANAIKAFYLLYYFGFRASEIINLKNIHIKQMVAEGKISLENNTKTKTPRDAYIAEKNISKLKEIFEENLIDEDDYSLISPTYHPRDYYSKGSLTKMLNTVLHQALGKQYSTHSFRAGYITGLHRANVSIKVIQKIIGHKKEVTTMRYISVSENELKDAVGRVA